MTIHIRYLHFHALTYISCFVLSGACQEGEQNGPTCIEEIVISHSLFNTASRDALFLNQLDINGNCLVVNFSASGCDGNTWQLMMIDSEKILYSDPPQRSLLFSLFNPEPCEALITKEISFDLTPLRIEGHQVRLRLTNLDTSILYRY